MTNLTLPSFLDDGDVREASGRLHAIETRELWRRWHGYARQHGGVELTETLDRLVAGDIPDTPQFRHWSHVTHALLRAYREGNDVHPSDVAHFEIDSLEPERLTQLHSLRLLEAFVGHAAASPSSGLEFDAFFATPDLPLRIDFGRAGRLTPEPEHRKPWSLSIHRGRIAIRLASASVQSSVALPTGTELTYPSSWRHEPALHLRQGSTLIHFPFYDAGLCNPHAGASAPIVRVPSVALEWLPTLSRAFYLAAADARLLAECVLYLPELLPLFHGLGQRWGSASTEDALGYAFLPGIRSPLDVAECFVHEAMHQKLFRIERVLPLLSSDSPTEERYYSPWRSDARPLRMVLHGTFVFTFVGHLWLAWAREPPEELYSLDCAYEIVWRRSCEVLAGLDLLSCYARPTEHGARLISELRQTVLALREDLPVSATYRDRVNTDLAAQRQLHVDQGSLCSAPLSF